MFMSWLAGLHELPVFLLRNVRIGDLQPNPIQQSRYGSVFSSASEKVENTKKHFGRYSFGGFPYIGYSAIMNQAPLSKNFCSHYYVSPRVDERNFSGSMRPTSLLLPLVTVAYPVLSE